MKLTRKIKKRIRPSVVGGFTSMRRKYRPIGYYKNRGIPYPFAGGEIGRIESIRFVVTPNQV